MKTALVTGATSGIGREIAKLLALSGWRIFVHGRDTNKVINSSADCGTSAEPIVADLSSVAETQNLAAEIRSRTGRLDALVLNAGTVTRKREVTGEGFEQMFAVNHLAPFVLTEQLSPIIAEGGQILVVSTDAHRWIPSLDLDNLQAEKRFRVLKHYAATKAANLMTSFEWSRRLTKDGIRVTAHHPGEVATGFGLQGPLWLRLFWKLSSRRFLAPADAAKTLVQFLADESDAVAVPYFSRGKPADPAPFTLDPTTQKAVWDATCSALSIPPLAD